VIRTPNIDDRAEGASGGSRVARRAGLRGDIGAGSLSSAGASSR
jgi:hypothetical protein